MKKNLLIVLPSLAVCILIAIGICFAVCYDFGGDNSIHIHDYGEWIINGEYHWLECKNEGCDERIKDYAEHVDTDGDGNCDFCNRNGVEHIHNYNAEVTAPTCVEQGFTTYTCLCGDSYKGDYTETVDHEYLNGKCRICGAEHDCNYSAVVTNPTCTAQGFTTYTCSCGRSYKDDYTESTEHDFYNGSCKVCGKEHDCEHTPTVTEPTCTTQGFTTYTCSCGDSYRGDYTETIEHAFYNGNCKVCGKEHDCEYTPTTVTEPTCTTQGFTIYTCSCGRSYEDDFTPFRHNYVDGKCLLCGALKPTDDLAYTLSGDGKYYFCSGIGTATDSKIVIASEYEGKPVQSVGDGAFFWCKSITSVILPEGIISVGERAFYGNGNITSVVFPESLTSICDDAFYECNKLTEITLPNNVNSLGRYAFSKCRFESIIIPDSVVTIGDSAFDDCLTLQNITIGKGLVSIGEGTFGGCGSIESIIISEENKKFHTQNNCIIETDTKKLVSGFGNSVIPDDGSVTIIGESAFYSSTIKSVTVPYGITVIASSAFLNCGLTSITLPEGLTSIDGSAFAQCYNLTDITLPESLTSIGNFAFRNCRNLTSITIPKNVTYVGKNIVEACKNLANITVDKENSKYYSRDNCLIEAESKTIISVCNGFIIPNDGSVTTIGELAFAYMETLTSITIPACISSIENSAFKYCENLREIKFEQGLTKIGSWAFLGCIELKAVTLPEGLTVIGDNAFRNCDGLIQITIPASVTLIDNYALLECENLTVITYNGTQLQWNLIEKGIEWNRNTGNYTVHCTDGDFSEEFTEGLSFTLSADGTYYICTGIGTATDTDIIIPISYNGKSVYSIAERAFYNCSQIKRVTIPNVISSIGLYAFGNCSGLEEVYIQGSVRRISNYAFYGCTNLTTVRLPVGISSLESYTFTGCTALKEIYFNGTMEEWKAIPHTDWLYITSCKVICSDGEIFIAGN